MNRRALIIGGTGMLGRGVAAELLAAGWEVTVGSRRAVAEPFAAHVEHVRLDRTVSGALAAAFRGRQFDLAVDAAAFRGDEAADAIGALAGRVGHYVFIGTDFVYAPDRTATFPLAEDAPKLRSYGYAAGKLDCEAILLEAFRRERFPVTILRPPHVLGAGKPPGCAPRALRDRNLLGAMRRGEPVVLVNEGQYLIQPVWSREIGRCIGRLALRPEAMGHALNCAGADCVTTLRYYEIVAEIAGVPLRVESIASSDHLKDHPGDAHMLRHRIYDLSRLRVTTGHAPGLSLRDALGETVEAFERAA